MEMRTRNIAFVMDEPPDGTRLVVMEDHLNDVYPAVLWRDDDRAARFEELRHHNADRRWFNGRNEYEPLTWGEAMVAAIVVYEVDDKPLCTRPRH